MTHPAWSDRKSCAECGRDMSADDHHTRCQPCRYGPGYWQRRREYFREWQRRARAEGRR